METAERGGRERRSSEVISEVIGSRSKLRLENKEKKNFKFNASQAIS